MVVPETEATEPETAAPDIGEHTDEILGELGFSAEDIKGLRAEKVV